MMVTIMLVLLVLEINDNGNLVKVMILEMIKV